MVGVSSLNLGNPYVMIMEQEHAATRKDLRKYIKRTIKASVVILILAVIATIIDKQYYLIPVIASSSIGTIIGFMMNTIRVTNLRRVGEIVFGEPYNIYAVNEADVYNTTRSICRMHGVIRGRNDALSFILYLNIGISAISIIHAIICMLMR